MSHRERALMDRPRIRRQSSLDLPLSPDPPDGTLLVVI